MLTESLLSSALPWKLYYGKTFKQNTESSNLPHFDAIELLQEENVSMMFLWCSKCMSLQLSFRNNASAHILKATTCTVPISSEAKEKITIFSRLFWIGTCLILCSACIPAGINIEVNI